MTPSPSVNGSVRQWQRYPAYKESRLLTGIQIPAHWSVMRLKYVAAVRPSNVDKKTVEGQEPVRLCNYVDVYKNDFITDDFDFMRASATPGQIAAFTLKAGDILITKDSETWEDIAVPALVRADLPGVLCGYHLALVRPDPRRIDGEYLFRCFSAEGICDQFRVAANGITRFGLGTSAINDAVFPFPPLDEQRHIAVFLVREMAKIDALIAKKVRLIELLQDKRTALISHTVTKGLDPTVPMQDSGMEWVGTVPAHWTPKKLKYLFRFAKRQNYPDRTVLSVYRDYGVIEKTTRDDNHNRTPEDLTTYQLVNVGDLVINKMKAWQGSLGISSLHGITSPDYVVYRSTNSEYLPYLHHRLRIPSMAATFHCISNGIRPDQWRLEPEKFEQLWLFLPPVEEQRYICEFIEKQLRGIDTLLGKVRDGIEKLNEYRTALISAAVTGKIDVSKEVVVGAEPKAVTEKPAAKPNPYFRRTVFAAEIIDRLCDEPTFGHVKFQKCLFVAQHHLRVGDFEENYKRMAAGPYDNRLIRSVDSQLEKGRWFKAEKVGDRYSYRRLDKAGGHRQYFDRYFGDHAEQLAKLLDLFRPLDTDRAEIAATLYAVWNDFLIRGETFDDDRIVAEVLTNWHDRKKRFDDAIWRRALTWMRDKGLVPTGFGKPTVPGDGKDG